VKRAGAAYVVERGHLVWLNFDPQAGHEQAGRRPALVLSPAGYNGRTGLALICPITSQVKGYPFEILLPPNLGLRGVVLADQLKSIDWRARQAQFADQCPKNILSEVLARIAPLLGL
jgi:mRNA interferase MazF